MSSVKVAVRVRPYNSREINMGAVLCVDMVGTNTIITDPETGKQRTFAFDYSYWSHDEYNEDPETGLMTPASSKYADQNRVFNDLGVEVLDNAFEGYNACLFAYGQTGAGKSYSMVGYGANKGIVPIACEEIFKRIKGAEDPSMKFMVTVSMLEIYNEQVQDLFVKPNNRPKGGLKIRQSPTIGTFVEGLSKCPVDSYESIEAKLEEGTSNRTVGATQMNATSSRAHTVLCISFVQIRLDEEGNPKSQKSSDINLVDLAGSERAAATGAQGDRLKEGCMINQSLSALGNVISALADKAQGKAKKGSVIPYRDSALTRILQNALGGNSKTTMIAAISPATVNFEETLSTLRYADRVKQIKNDAQINEDPNEKLIRELKAENERLKLLLEGKPLPELHAEGSDNHLSSQADSDSDQGENGSNNENGDFEEQMRANELAMLELNKTWEEKLKEAEERAKASVSNVTADISLPHMKNLNEDPFLSGKLIHSFKEGEWKVGRRSDSNNVDIVLAGLGIQKHHCTITHEDGDVYIEPGADNGKTFLNGRLLTQKKQLFHNDRLLFGNHNLFLFIDPEEVSNETYDWEQAMKEIHHAAVADVGLTDSKAEEEMKKKLQQMEEAMVRERQEAQQRMEEQRAEMEQQRLEMQRQLEEKEKTLLQEMKANESTAVTDEMTAKVQALELQLKKEKEAAQKQMEKQKEELDRKQRELQEAFQRQQEEVARQEHEMRAQKMLEEQLTRTIMLVNEAQAISDEMEKKVQFSLKLITKMNPMDRAKRKANSAMQHTELWVKVDYEGANYTSMWDLDKFNNRIYLMREMYLQWLDEEDNFQYDEDRDPFLDPIQECHLIGYAHIYLESLGYLLDVQEATPIVDYKGKVQGELLVSLNPKVQSSGKRGDDDDSEDIDKIDDLLGRPINLCVKILSARGLPERYSRNVYCSYKLFGDPTDYKTQECNKRTVNPEFKYEQWHKLTVTTELVQKVWENALQFEVFGCLSEETMLKPIVQQTRPSTQMNSFRPSALIIPGAEVSSRSSLLASGLLSPGLLSPGLPPSPGVPVNPSPTRVSPRPGSANRTRGRTSTLNIKPTGNHANGLQPLSPISPMPSLSTSLHNIRSAGFGSLQTQDANLLPVDKLRLQYEAQMNAMKAQFEAKELVLQQKLNALERDPRRGSIAYEDARRGSMSISVNGNNSFTRKDSVIAENSSYDGRKLTREEELLRRIAELEAELSRVRNASPDGLTAASRTGTPNSAFDSGANGTSLTRRLADQEAELSRLKKEKDDRDKKYQEILKAKGVSLSAAEFTEVMMSNGGGKRKNPKSSICIVQ